MCMCVCVCVGVGCAGVGASTEHRCGVCQPHELEKELAKELPKELPLCGPQAPAKSSDDFVDTLYKRVRMTRDEFDDTVQNHQK